MSRLASLSSTTRRKPCDSMISDGTSRVRLGAPLRGFETFSAKHPCGGRRRKKLEQRLRRHCLPRAGKDARGQHRNILKLLRQRPHEVDAGNGHQLWNLLDGEL